MDKTRTGKRDWWLLFTKLHVRVKGGKKSAKIRLKKKNNLKTVKCKLGAFTSSDSVNFLLGSRLPGENQSGTEPNRLVHAFSIFYKPLFFRCVILKIKFNNGIK